MRPSPINRSGRRHNRLDAIDIALTCAMGLVAVSLFLIRAGVPM